MRHDPSPFHPAAAAIAAVLALSSPPAVAQVADVAAPSGANAADPAVSGSGQITAQPADPAATTPVPSTATNTEARTIFSPHQEIVQPMAPQPEQAAIQPEASAPEKASSAETNRKSPSVMAAHPAAAMHANTVDANEVERLDVPSGGPANIVPSVPQRAIADPLFNERADTVAPDDDKEVPGTAVSLGLAVLLAGAGAYVATRRRRPSAKWSTDARGASVHTASPLVPAPVAASALSKEASTTTPRVSEAIAEPGWPVTDRNTLQDWREAMVAEPPSTENPFLTRRNRLRRANFLLRRAVDHAGERAAVLSRPVARRIAGANEGRGNILATLKVTYSFT